MFRRCLVGFAVLSACVFFSLHHQKSHVSLESARTAVPSDVPLAEAGIECTSAVFDFGSCWDTDVPAHAFSLRNTSSKTISIREVVPSCSCVHGEIHRSVLGPSEDSNVDFKMTLSGLNGRVQKRLLVYYGESLWTPIVLTVSGSVLPTVTSSPKRLDFGNVPVKESTARTLTLHLDGPRIGQEIKKIQWESPIVEVSQLPPRTNQEIKLLVAVNPERLDRFEGRIEFIWSSPDAITAIAYEGSGF